MSLKGFHIVFITVSTLLALGVGAWCLWVNSIEGAPVFRIGAICVVCRGGWLDRFTAFGFTEK